MPLAIGACLGPYEILAPLGAGAMGEVYRARDSRLGREVAVKLLPASFVGSPERLRRFEQEARAASALNHPNILTVHDVGTHDGAPYLVSELLIGESLRARLDGGALPLRSAIEIAAQIARGLAAAHERGIVHRDLKPENVFIASAGQVKILDFGLAKREPARLSDSEMAAAETLEFATGAGVVLGTVGYMSPEQVRGLPADSRSDIFSFGCLLYEMLAGRQAFRHDTAAETMAAILREDPPSLPADLRLPPALERIVWHCLEKRPEARFQSAPDIAFALENLSGSSRSAAAPGLPRALRRQPWLWLGAGLALLIGVALGRGFRPSGPAPDAKAPRATFLQLTDLPGVVDSPRLSPDGKTLIFVSRVAGKADIYLQRVGGHNPINLTKDCAQDDTEPAFSPDGERIAFRSECEGGGIFVMGATGESRRRVTDFGHDPAWSPDGTRLAVATMATRDPLYRTGPSQLWVVEVATGAKRPLNAGDAMQPSWSPSGRRIAYWGLRGRVMETGQRDLWTISAEGGLAADVTNDEAVDWNPVWSPDGRFLYFTSNRGGSMNLWRIGIEESSGRVQQPPAPMTTPALWSGQIGVSGDGRRLVYATRNERSSFWRVGFDPMRCALVGTAQSFFSRSRVVFGLDLSPDGQWIAFAIRGPQEDLFVVRADGSGYRQITDDVARDRFPAWSPDGARIAFQSNRSGHYEIWGIRPDGSGLERLVTARSAVLPNWSPDGRTIGVTVGPWQSYLVPAGRTLDDPLTRQLPPIGGGLVFVQGSWSPDGTRLAGLGARQDGLLSGIFTWSLASGSYQRVLATTPTSVFARPRWMPDGQSITYVEDGGLFLLDTRSQRSTELLPRHTFGGTTADYGFSRDARTLVYSNTTAEGDVWLMTLE